MIYVIIMKKRDSREVMKNEIIGIPMNKESVIALMNEAFLGDLI